MGEAESLNIDLLRIALRDAIERHEIHRVVISGGEPTLVPNLTELIEVIASCGSRPSLCTNAIRIRDDYAIELRVAGLRSTTVGIEGTDETYDWFRGGTRGFERAVRGIAALRRADVNVTVNITLHNRILGHATDFGASLSGLNLSSISVTSPIVQGRLASNRDSFTQVSLEAVEAFAEQLAQSVDSPVSLRVPRCDHASCPSGNTVFAMDRYGVVSGCPDVGSTNAVDRSPSATDVLVRA